MHHNPEGKNKTVPTQMTGSLHHLVTLDPVGLDLKKADEDNHDTTICKLLTSWFESTCCSRRIGNSGELLKGLMGPVSVLDSNHRHLDAFTNGLTKASFCELKK